MFEAFSPKEKNQGASGRRSKTDKRKQKVSFLSWPWAKRERRGTSGGACHEPKKGIDVFAKQKSLTPAAITSRWRTMYVGGPRSPVGSSGGAGKPGSFRVCVPAPESSNPPYPCLRRSVLPSLQLYLLSPYDGPHRTRTSHPSRSKADPSRSKAENVSRDYSQRASLHRSWRSGDIPHGFGLTLTALRIRCSLS